MNSKVVLIIGGGQLGARHLQGLLKCNIHQIIYVLDTSDISLKSCQLRESEIEHTQIVIYTTNWDVVPPAVSLAIISTNSNVRYNLLERLLEHSSVENIILEKILFQSLKEYDSVNELMIRNKNCNFWVNYPRRESLFYRELKLRLNGRININSAFIYGEDWGLACNSLHFIDMLSFICRNNDPVYQRSFLSGKDAVGNKRMPQ